MQANCAITLAKKPHYHICWYQGKLYRVPPCCFGNVQEMLLLNACANEFGAQH